MSESNGKETSASETETQSTTPSTETTATTTTETKTEEGTKPSLISEASGKDEGKEAGAADAGEGDKGAPKSEGDADFVPLTPDDIKLPDGFEKDDEVLGEFVEVMNDRKLSEAERAQKLVDLQAKAMSKASESISQTRQEMQDQWREEVQKMPEFGGEALPKTLGHISRLIEGYGGTKEQQTALRQVMDFTLAGDNPHMIAFLGRLAKELVEEGAPVVGAPGSQKSGASLAERMFPDNPTSGKG